MKKISRIVLVLLVAVLMTSVCTSALAEWTWNERVEIMVPAGEGGGLDTTIRKFSTYLSKALGTTITVQNKSGSVGVDGFVWAKNQTNNGFAFQFTAPSAMLSDAQGLFPGFKLRDILHPVSGLVQAEGILFGREGAPWNDINELIAYAKDHRVTVAVDSPNGISGALIREFEEAAGVKFTWITSDSAEAYVSVISGDIDICLNTWSDAGAYVGNGLTALVVCAEQRNPAYPDVVCTGELGLNTTFGYWRVFTALEGTPQEAIDSFEAAVHEAAQDPEWVEWLAGNGMTNDYLWSQAELAEVIDSVYDFVENSAK